MNIILKDNRWLYLSNVSPDIDDLIYDYFSASDPNVKYIDNIREQSWDGVYRKYYRTKQRLSQGFLLELLRLCKKHNIPIEINDLREPTKYPMFTAADIRPNLLSGVSLMNHQLEGLIACAKRTRSGFLLNETGILFYITGAGKTEMMCGIAKLLKCPTIIVAEETVVVDQIKKRLELRDVANDVGVFYAGQSPSGQLVCVGSLASLRPPNKIKRKKNEKPEKYQARLKAHKTRMKHYQVYKKLLAECELLMIDECDKAATNKEYRRLVMQHTNSRYLYGFTGTLPMDEDELDKLNLTEVLGSVIAKSNRRYLEKIGRIIPVKYVNIVFGENNHHDRSTFDIAIRELIEENEALHRKVKQITDNFPNDNFLILVENIALGENLEAMIPGSKFIYGKTRKKIRNQTLEKFENKKLRVLIGSKILKRGLDLRGGVDNLILCASSKKDSDLEQKVGRALRINERGWGRVFDFLFINNFYLYKHSRRRLKRMIQLGYPTTVVAPKKAFDGKDVIRRGFNLFRYV